MRPAQAVDAGTHVSVLWTTSKGHGGAYSALRFDPTRWPPPFEPESASRSMTGPGPVGQCAGRGLERDSSRETPDGIRHSSPPNRRVSGASGASPGPAGAHAKLGDPGYPGDGYHHAATDGSNQQGHPDRDGAT